MRQILDMLGLMPPWVYVASGLGIALLFVLVWFLERPR